MPAGNEPPEDARTPSCAVFSQTLPLGMLFATLSGHFAIEFLNYQALENGVYRRNDTYDDDGLCGPRQSSACNSIRNKIIIRFYNSKRWEFLLPFFQKGFFMIKMNDVKAKATAVGVSDPSQNKADLIKQIQRAEGFEPCFKTKSKCDQTACCWREECVKK